MESRHAYLGIALSPDIWRFCRHVQDDEAVSLFRCSDKQLAASLKINMETARSVAVRLRAFDFDREQRRLKTLGISFITRSETDYPDPLRQIYDPPAALFFKGSIKGLNAPAVAMIGARRSTAYGRSVAKEMAGKFAAAGLTVVSGMARGIDSAVHEGALEYGRTVAVLGCGPDIVYPPENKGLASRIIERGALISEYPPGTPPRQLNFPRRNRLISGLAAAVVVVEASVKSGALITADFALEQGREVFVVPGSVNSPVSAGCHNLLKEGAGLAAGAGDVLEALGLEMTANEGSAEPLSGDESALLNLIDYEKTRIDDILEKADRPADRTMGELTLLEAKGYICKQLGGWYLRIK